MPTAVIDRGAYRYEIEYLKRKRIRDSYRGNVLDLLVCNVEHRGNLFRRVITNEGLTLVHFTNTKDATTFCTRVSKCAKIPEIIEGLSYSSYMSRNKPYKFIKKLLKPLIKDLSRPIMTKSLKADTKFSPKAILL